MSNFVFSNELEISILEHRMTKLLDIVTTAGVQTLYPSILFNETFWLQSFEKRVSIIAGNQLEWLGDSPLNSSVFFADPFFLDLIKSVKLTFFAYTKLNLEGIIDILKARSKFSVTDFKSLGDEKESPIALANDISLSVALANNLKDQEQELNALAKILAVKIYSLLLEKKTINVLVFFLKPNINFWETIFEAFSKLDEAKNTSFIKKLTINFITNDLAAKDLLDEEIKQSERLSSFRSEERIIVNQIALEDLNLKEKYDYILFETFFSGVANDILIKYGRNFYNAVGRLSVKRREDIKKAIELVAELTSPIKNFKNISVEDLKDLDFELIWEKYNNANVIKLIEESSEIVERTYLRFSILSLKTLIKTIKNLSKEGVIHILDYAENSISQYTLGYFIDKNSIIRTQFAEDLYQKILGSFSDISVSMKSEDVQNILSKEVLKGEGSFIKISDLIKYITQEIVAGREFFNVNHFDNFDKLHVYTEKLKSKTVLKQKKIMSLGLSTFLYRSGLGNLTSMLRSDKDFSKYFDSDEFIPSNDLDSYDKEFIIFLIPKVIRDLSVIGNTLITNNEKSSQNERFIAILKFYGLNQEKIFAFLNKEWENLEEISKLSQSLKLIEIKSN